MHPCNNPKEPLPPKEIVPKDGYGPRGWPDCYYTSRVLDSTFRYVRYIKKLRALEEEQRRGAANNLKAQKDQQYSDFFIRCDRRSLIKQVARRVDLCMTSYQEDLKEKRQRLIDMLQAEEEENIRKFAVQAQAGAEALWQEKKDRLAYLLAKRQKEHEDKYKDTPLSKCVHVYSCIYKMRAKETAEAQLYQIREKQARKMAEMECDKMWHALAMKEADALAARMELETIERARKDRECKMFSDYQLEMRRQEREKEREALKQEALRYKKMAEDSEKEEREKKRQEVLKRDETMKERKETLKERQDMLKKQQAEVDLIGKTWDSLAGMGLTDDKILIERRRQMEKELDLANKKIREMTKARDNGDDDKLVDIEAKRQQDVLDKKRCEMLLKTKKANEESRVVMLQQIKDNETRREQKRKEHADEMEYHRQLKAQIDQLVAHREMTEQQAKKLYQQQLLQQIDYNNLLKQRAQEEELDQQRKCVEAGKEYLQEINRMLCRPFFCDAMHPFMKPLYRGVEMKQKCPCSKDDYCATPESPPYEVKREWHGGRLYNKKVEPKPEQNVKLAQGGKEQNVKLAKGVKKDRNEIETKVEQENQDGKKN